MLALLLLGIVKGSISEDHSVQWNNRDDNGSENLKNFCTQGSRQSPIDIRAIDVDYALLHRMNFIQYNNAGPISVVNNGYTVKGEGFEKWGRKQPFIQGGGLRHRYKLVEFHLHWSQNDINGSEHKISGLQYAAELHLVHVRQDLSLNEALKKPDGLAVLAVFVLIGRDGTPFAKFSSSFAKVIFPGYRTTLEGFRTRVLLPAHTEAFYRYYGSITVPECNEAVVWTVFSEPISMTNSQLTFRRLRLLQSRAQVQRPEFVYNRSSMFFVFKRPVDSRNFPTEDLNAAASFGDSPFKTTGREYKQEHRRMKKKEMWALDFKAKVQKC